MAFKTTKQRAREKVVQALYQWQILDDDITKIEKQFLQQKDVKISKAFFSDLFTNITKNIVLLDELIKPTIDRKINELGIVEHAILYLGAYELKFSSEVPYKVIINEAVEIAKNYAADGSYKLINKSLDKLAKKLRDTELNP